MGGLWAGSVGGLRLSGEVEGAAPQGIRQRLIDGGCPGSQEPLDRVGVTGPQVVLGDHAEFADDLGGVEHAVARRGEPESRRD